jgi:hypothetical protein
MQDMGNAIPGNVYDTVMDAYFNFGAQNTNGSALALVTAAQNSIDSTIAKDLQSGADVTGLVKLRSQMESGLGGSATKSLLAPKAISPNAMADAVITLLKLPTDVQTKISAENVNKAYFDYLTAGKKGKAAAQAKAVEVLFANAQAAIASGKLNAAQGQELRGLMVDIDSERSVGDNGRGIRKTKADLLKESTCSVNDLYQYLKNINSDFAEDFIRNGIWPDGEQIPKSPDVLNPDGTINWKKAPKGGYVLDKDGNAIKEGYWPFVGEIVDRYGPSSGRFTSPIRIRPYSYTKRSLPYLEDTTQYHQYKVVGDFSMMEQYVENCQDENLKNDIYEYIDAYYEGDFSKLLVYKGKIAGIKGWGIGGGVQYELPMKVEWLEALGILQEIN